MLVDKLFTYQFILTSDWDLLVALVACNRKALFKLNFDNYAAISHHKEGGFGPGGPGDRLFQRILRTLAVGLMSGELFEGERSEDDKEMKGVSSSSQSSIVEDDSGVKEKKPLIEKGDKVSVVEYDDKSSSKQLSSLQSASTTTTTTSSSTTTFFAGSK